MKQCSANALAKCEKFPCIDLRQGTEYHHIMWQTDVWSTFNAYGCDANTDPAGIAGDYVSLDAAKAGCILEPLCTGVVVYHGTTSGDGWHLCSDGESDWNTGSSDMVYKYTRSATVTAYLGDSMTLTNSGGGSPWTCSCTGCVGLTGTWTCPGFYEGAPIVVTTNYADDFLSTRTDNSIDVCQQVIAPHSPFRTPSPYSVGSTQDHVYTIFPTSLTFTLTCTC